MTKKIVVIGAGPGGYVAAIKGAQLGAEIVLIERDQVGGTCLNRGCIPTKTYFRTAELMRDYKRNEEFAIVNSGAPKVDGEKLQERKQKIVGQLVGGIEQLIKSYPNIRFLRGNAELIDKNTVLVHLNDGGEEKVICDNIVLATGSTPQMTETVGVHNEGVITSDDLLELKEIPETLIVVGGGVIGLEFASIYQELGSHVILLASRILKNADKEIGKRLVPMLKKQGMEVYVDIRAKEITREDGKLKVVAKYKTKDEEITVRGNYVLIASGRGPVIDGLGLEKLGIETDAAGIIVNDSFETSVPGVYAIGDVNRSVQLAHVASAQGEWIMEHLMGQESEINLDVYPNCVFTMNEVSHVGWTEEELKEKGIEYVSSKFQFAANGKALSLGEGEGLLKVLAEPTGKILGVHILGPHANDLIMEATLAMANGMSVQDIAKAIHPHPTLSEVMAEASAGIRQSAIHIAPAKKRM